MQNTCIYSKIHAVWREDPVFSAVVQIQMTLFVLIMPYPGQWPLDVLVDSQCHHMYFSVIAQLKRVLNHMNPCPVTTHKLPTPQVLWWILGRQRYWGIGGRIKMHWIREWSDSDEVEKETERSVTEKLQCKGKSMVWPSALFLRQPE